MKLLLLCLLLSSCASILPKKPVVPDVLPCVATVLPPCPALPKIPAGADQKIISEHHALLADLYALCAARK